MHKPQMMPECEILIIDTQMVIKKKALQVQQRSVPLLYMKSIFRDDVFCKRLKA